MTAKQRLDMYKHAHDSLVSTVVKLQDFAENKSEFFEGNPTPEQEQAAYDANTLTDLIGKYAVKVKRFETA